VYGGAVMWCSKQQLVSATSTTESALSRKQFEDFRRRLGMRPAME
jgi:hypothetical protein